MSEQEKNPIFAKKKTSDKGNTYTSVSVNLNDLGNVIEKEDRYFLEIGNVEQIKKSDSNGNHYLNFNIFENLSCK